MKRREDRDDRKKRIDVPFTWMVGRPNDYVLRHNTAPAELLFCRGTGAILRDYPRSRGFVTNGGMTRAVNVHRVAEY